MHPILSAAPFNLSPEDIAWVETTLASLTPAERIAQLFNLDSWGNDPAELARMATLQPGGVTRFCGPDADRELAFLDGVRQGAKVPSLLSADLESSRRRNRRSSPMAAT